MAGEVAHDAELEVRERADGERHALGREARDERGVLEAAVAMVDAVDLEQVERLMHIFGRPLLAGVRDDPEPDGAGARKDALEFRWRMADFGRIAPAAVDAIQPGHRGVDRRFGLGFPALEEEAPEPPSRHPVAWR